MIRRVRVEEVEVGAGFVGRVEHRSSWDFLYISFALGNTQLLYTQGDCQVFTHNSMPCSNPAESDNKGAFTGMVHDAYMSSRVDKQDHSRHRQHVCMVSRNGR
jgi:hypothetical protein